jgi:hypothetical protein
MEAAFDLFGRTPRVREFEVLKFPEVLLPGQRFALRVERSPAGDRLEFRLGDGDRVFAAGRCRLVAGEGDAR